jgi:thiamine-monophosphate kinase
MTEQSILNWLRKQKNVEGIGDDCAVLNEWLVTTDMFIEDIHFLRSLPPETCGYRALARGLSDIAAMGGDPRWCLLSLALADWCGERWVRGFYRGLLKLAEKFAVKLVGGDLSHSNRVTADIVVIGFAPKGKALRRDGARVGDGIYVSGALGGRPVLPEPRIAFGKKLRGRASACMDLSDGLSLDLKRLCEASGVAAVIDLPLPVAPGATIEQALHAGEDYELLYTAPRKAGGTRIGTIVRGKPGRVEFFGRKLAAKGYDHFRSNRGD